MTKLLALVALLLQAPLHSTDLAWSAPTATVTAAGITLAWDANTEPDIAGYVVAYGTQTMVYGVSVDVGKVTTWTLADPKPGAYYFAVRAMNTAGASSPFSSEVSTTVSAPTCTDIPSLFITRWEMTTGRPGSRMRVNFQPASISPIVEIQAKVNGQVVATITGTDLRETAGVWFTTPALGTYKLQVWAKNAAGCTREVYSPVDLVVK